MGINIFLFLAGVFLVTFFLGRFIEKARIPWIFAALLVGLGLAAAGNPFSSITQGSDIFTFLAHLGMYFLLFIIGFEIDLKKLRKTKDFIFKSTFFIILLEAVLGTSFIFFISNFTGLLQPVSLLISTVVALSFATVGEAILVPILDEFKLTNTKLGQSIIGIGTLDDLIEIFVLIIVVILVSTGIGISGFSGGEGSFLGLSPATGSAISSSSSGDINILTVFVSLFFIFGLTFLMTQFKEGSKKFSFTSIENLFIFLLFILFLFLGVGSFSHAAPIAALLAGISLKTFLPASRLENVEKEIKTMCYGFFAPIFFLWVGAEVNFSYILAFPLVILLFVLVSKSAKLIGSYTVGKKELGTRGSLLLGIGLSVRFSTSIVIIKILFEKGIVASDLYSVVIASSIVFKFLVPVLFSTLLVRWGFSKRKKNKSNKEKGEIK